MRSMVRAFLIALGLLVGASIALCYGQDYGQSTPQQPYRIDTFDHRSNRTGHLIVDPRTGRFDAYDTRSNRRSTGTISPPPAQNGGRIPSTIRSQPLGGGKR